MDIQAKLQEVKSWALTFAADLLVDFAAGVLVGLGTLVETGDVSSAAVMAVVTASARSVLKMAQKRLGSAMKKTAKSLKSM